MSTVDLRRNYLLKIGQLIQSSSQTVAAEVRYQNHQLASANCRTEPSTAQFCKACGHARLEEESLKSTSISTPSPNAGVLMRCSVCSRRARYIRPSDNIPSTTAENVKTSPSDTLIRQDARASKPATGRIDKDINTKQNSKQRAKQRKDQTGLKALLSKSQTSTANSGLSLLDLMKS